LNLKAIMPAEARAEWREPRAQASGGNAKQLEHSKRTSRMKRLFISVLIGLTATTLLTGCLAIQLGGGTTSHSQNPTVGQQLVDLQHAKDTGAINDAEYQQQKAKILQSK
jgi:hypothetical protein